VQQAYGRVALHWSASDLPTLAGYNVYRRTAGSSFARLNAEALHTTAYTDTNVVNGTDYIYKVTTVSTDLFEYDYTGEISARPDDYTKPDTPAVSDDGTATHYVNRLHAQWQSQDPESGIAEYQYAIGTSSGGTDVISWTSAGGATGITRTNLSLQDGTTYYVSAKARNGAGQWSDVGASDGILVQWLASPAVSAVWPPGGIRTQAHALTITGTNFLSSPLPVVRLGSQALSDVTWQSSSQITASVPAYIQAGVYDVTVTNWDGQVALLAQVYTATNPVAAPAPLSLNPAAAFVGSGEERQVNVEISGAQDLAGFQFDLRFDPNVVQANSAWLGWFLSSSGRGTASVGPTIDNANGRVTFGGYSYGTSPGANGSGTLATVTFAPVGSAPASSALTLENIQLIDTINTAMPADPQAGQIRIVVYPFGDFDHDCEVTVNDIMQVAYRWNSHSGDGTYDPQYDFDGDGDIDIVDIMRVANAWGDTCPGGSGVASAQTMRTTSLAPVGQGQWIVSDSSVEAGDLFTLTLQAQGLSDLAAYQATLHYDAGALEIVSVEPVPLWAGDERQTIFVGPKGEPGALTFGAFSFGEGVGLSGDHALVTIRARLLRPGETALRLDGIRTTDVAGQLLPALRVPGLILNGRRSQRIYLPVVLK